MFEKLIGVEERFIEVEKQLSDPKIVNDRNAYQTYVREHAELNKVVMVYRQYQQTLNDLDDSQDLLKDADPDIKDLARDEIAALNREKEDLEAELKKLLLPKDPNDEKNVIVEIRAGTGGEEAALFAGDLYRMYSRYAESRNWKMATFKKNYLLAEEKRKGIVIFQATYQRTPHAKLSEDGKLRDLNSEYFWLTVTNQSILPRPGIWDRPPLPFNMIYT